jgi:hypothetical protein
MEEPPNRGESTAELRGIVEPEGFVRTCEPASRKASDSLGADRFGTSNRNPLGSRQLHAHPVSDPMAAPHSEAQERRTLT